jgi:hypothetical protein
MNSLLIPCLEPTNTEIASNAKNLVYAVLENGQDFENMIRAAEQGNPAYDFLVDTGNEGYYFYRWFLFCLGDGLRQEAIDSIFEQHRRYIKECYAGSLNLSIEDIAQLNNQLHIIDGSKDSIRLFRRWILSRAHSMIAIGNGIEKYISQILQSNSHDKFTKFLHILYGMNDVLFNASSASMIGPYTALLFPGGDATLENISVDVVQCLFKALGICLHAAYTSATDEVGRGIYRIYRIYRIRVNYLWLPYKYQWQVNTLIFLLTCVLNQVSAQK